MTGFVHERIYNRIDINIGYSDNVCYIAEICIYGNYNTTLFDGEFIYSSYRYEYLHTVIEFNYVENNYSMSIIVIAGLLL